MTGPAERIKRLQQAGLTDYTAINDDALDIATMRAESVVVGGANVPCAVIKITYRERPNGGWQDANRPSSWTQSRTLWVDTTRNVVLKEVDAVIGKGSLDGIRFEHTITVRNLVWNARPPDTAFDMPMASGVVLADGTVTAGRDGRVPAVPVVEGCDGIADPLERTACLGKTQVESCSRLPISPEVAVAGLSGSVVVSYVIDRQGGASQVRVTEPMGLGIDELAAGCVSEWRFRPAQKDGSPVEAPSAVRMPIGRDGDSAWHLRRVEFHPEDGATRPVFLKTAYPQRQEVKGYAVFHINLTIDAAGAPRDVEVTSGAGPAFDRQAAKIVQSWRFRPGQRDGVPVGVPAAFTLALGRR